MVRIITFLVFSFFFVSQSNSQVALQYNRIDDFGDDDIVGDLSVDENTLWVASKKGVFSYYVDGGPASQVVDHDDAVEVVHKDRLAISGFKDNSIYVNNKFLLRLEDNFMTVTDIAVYNKKIWVGTSAGLFVFNAKNQSMELTLNTRNSQLKSNYIKFIYADKSNFLWIGTKKGVFRVDQNTWSQCYEAESEMMAITEYLGYVWLMSDRQMWEIESKSNKWYPANLKGALYKGNINEILLDNDGMLYVASESLIQFDPKKSTTQDIGKKLGLSNIKYLSLAMDRQNRIYVGTEGKGLFRIDEIEEVKEELKILALIDNPIDCFGNMNGSLILEVTGGKDPLDYKWNPPNVKGSNPNNLRSGVYTVTVVDSNGSTGMQSINIEDPNPLSMKIVEKKELTSLSKKNGQCTIELTGGSKPYEIKWDNGETGKTARNLNFGIHKIEITDSQGCLLTEHIEIEKAKILPELNINTLRVGQKVRIDKLLFLADSDIIDESSKPVLDEIRAFMIANENIIIEIGGHTNNVPKEEYCNELSTNRAKNVANYIGFVGIDAHRIKYNGYGKRKPISTNKTPEGRIRNQRVEIKILEILPK